MTDQHSSPAGDQVARAHADQPAENTDADKLPDEFPERPRGAFQHGTTVDEQRRGESLDQRLAQEHPDTRMPDGGLSTTTTPLVDDADPDGRDTQKDLVSERPLTEPHVDDSGQPSVDAPAEQQAVRAVDADDVPGAVDRRGR